MDDMTCESGIGKTTGSEVSEELTAQVIKTDNFGYNVASMEYFYRTVANSYISMINSYGMSSYIKIDSGISHKLQQCPMTESGTWFDFFLDMTISEVTKLLSCAEAANAEGITLDDEDYSLIDDEIENLKSNAEFYGYSLKEYIKTVYGSAVTEDVIRECLELQLIYNRYINAHIDAADTSDKALEKLYSENKETYDIVNYLTFTFDYNNLYLDEEEQKEAEAEESGTSYSTTDRDEAITKSRLDVGELKVALDAADTLEEKTKIFNDFIKDYLTDEFGFTDEQYEVSKDNFNITTTYKKDDKILEWAFDEHTAAGDVKMFVEKEKHDHKEGDDESKLADVYTVVLLTKTAGRDESLATADIRHILFSKDDYKDDTKANDVLEELKMLMGTDRFTAKFEELAKEYSADTANKDKGGLMKGLAKGQTVTEFDNWVFDGENGEGDLGIVETKDYGWHVVYFEKEGLPTWKNTLINGIKAEAQAEAESMAMEKYSVSIDDAALYEGIDA